jgi:hypothetical protein
MKTTIEVRGKQYQIELGRPEKPEGEKFNLCPVRVQGQEGGEVRGTLKVTDLARERAKERASREGGNEDDWLARACGRSLAAEVLIRKLQPDFSFLVDHRWLERL